MGLAPTSPTELLIRGMSDSTVATVGSATQAECGRETGRKQNQWVTMHAVLCTTPVALAHAEGLDKEAIIKIVQTAFDALEAPAQVGGQNCSVIVERHTQ